jgi:8-oxo-dGTP pyrophosphatase MutT (NUDIX family)
MTPSAQTLLDELHSYTPADSVEARHHEEMIGLVRSASDPFSRAWFEPGHITASCFILDLSGRLLLHHHRRLGRWLQMGGHVEGGESASEAARREGREESGLQDLELVAAIFDLDIHPIPAAKGEPDHRHFDVRYLARTRTPESIRIDEAESTGLAWVDLPRAVTLMASAESARVISKIEKVLWRS